MRILLRRKDLTAAIHEFLFLYIQPFLTEQLNEDIPAEPAKIPVICGEGGMANAGGTASVAIDYYVLGYRAGEMAYEIMVNGADPATMPIGFMTADDMELIINEENAAAIGLVIPEDLK